MTNLTQGNFKYIEKNQEIVRLNSIFSDLKLERTKNREKIFPIDGKRKLKPTIFTRNFQGLLAIRYNKKFFLKKSSVLDDQCLRLILLHEEYHVKSGVIFDLIKAGAIFFTLLIVFNFLFESIFINLMNFSVSTFFYIFGDVLSIFLFYSFLLVCLILKVLIPFFITYRFFYSKLYNDEFLADYYAANTLKEFFSEGSPSLVIEKVLLAFSEEKSKSLIPVQILSIFYYIFPDYHPEKTIRIERIHSAVDIKKM